MNSHLHILHLPPITGRPKTDKVSEVRLDKLIKELNSQEITDYSIIDGFYERRNTKKAIHGGHKKIVELARAQEMPNVIIAEDDIVFSSPKSYEYFLSQIPESYDLFCGLIYAGKTENNRVISAASGIMTLYSVHSRFYDFFLSINSDTHIDRELSATALQHEYYLCNPMVVYQRGGFSHNLNRIMFYHEYLRDIKLYGQ